MDTSRDWKKSFNHIGHWFKPNPTRLERNYHLQIFTKCTGRLNSISNRENKQLQLLGAVHGARDEFSYFMWGLIHIRNYRTNWEFLSTIHKSTKKKNYGNSYAFIYVYIFISVYIYKYIQVYNIHMDIYTFLFKYHRSYYL